MADLDSGPSLVPGLLLPGDSLPALSMPREGICCVRATEPMANQGSSNCVTSPVKLSRAGAQGLARKGLEGAEWEEAVGGRAEQG